MNDYNIIVNAASLQPIYFTGNIPVIRIPAATEKVINISIERGQETPLVIQERYEPFAETTGQIGQIGQSATFIYLTIRDLVHKHFYSNYADLTFGDLNVSEQKSGYGKVTVTDDEETEICAFFVVRGTLGVERFVNAQNYFRKNMLTLQPQVRYIQPDELVMLNFYTTENCVIKARSVRRKNAPINTIDYVTLTSHNRLHTIKFTWNQLFQLFDFDDLALFPLQNHPLIFFEIYAEGASGTRTFPMRVMLKRKQDTYEQMFLFENSQGGVDSIVFDGELVEKSQHEFLQSVIFGTVNEYDTIPKVLYEKITGYIETPEEKQWVSDFLASHNRYAHHDGAFVPIFIDNYKDEKTSGQPDQFSFTYGFRMQNVGKTTSRLDIIPWPTNLNEKF